MIKMAITRNKKAQPKATVTAKEKEKEKAKAKPSKVSSGSKVTISTKNKPRGQVQNSVQTVEIHIDAGKKEKKSRSKKSAATTPAAKSTTIEKEAAGTALKAAYTKYQTEKAHAISLNLTLPPNLSTVALSEDAVSTTAKIQALTDEIQLKTQAIRDIESRAQAVVNRLGQKLTGAAGGYHTPYPVPAPKPGSFVGGFASPLVSGTATPSYPSYASSPYTSRPPATPAVSPPATPALTTPATPAVTTPPAMTTPAMTTPAMTTPPATPAVATPPATPAVATPALTDEEVAAQLAALEAGYNTAEEMTDEEKAAAAFQESSQDDPILIGESAAIATPPPLLADPVKAAAEEEARLAAEAATGSLSPAALTAAEAKVEAQWGAKVTAAKGKIAVLNAIGKQIQYQIDHTPSDPALHFALKEFVRGKLQDAYILKPDVLGGPAKTDAEIEQEAVDAESKARILEADPTAENQAAITAAEVEAAAKRAKANEASRARNAMARAKAKAEKAEKAAEAAKVKDKKERAEIDAALKEKARVAQLVAEEKVSLELEAEKKKLAEYLPAPGGTAAINSAAKNRIKAKIAMLTKKLADLKAGKAEPVGGPVGGGPVGGGEGGEGGEGGGGPRVPTQAEKAKLTEAERVLAKIDARVKASRTAKLATTEGTPERAAADVQLTKNRADLVAQKKYVKQLKEFLAQGEGGAPGEAIVNERSYAGQIATNLASEQRLKDVYTVPLYPDSFSARLNPRPETPESTYGDLLHRRYMMDKFISTNGFKNTPHDKRRSYINTILEETRLMTRLLNNDPTLSAATKNALNEGILKQIEDAGLPFMMDTIRYWGGDASKLSPSQDIRVNASNYITAMLQMAGP